MNYAEIDSVLASNHLGTDPAFDRLNIRIESTPDLDGCPLGLYYPDTATVVIPVNSTQGTLLHELGHRHGHYYRGDLSEHYAESFRRKYQKGRALLYYGNNFNNMPRLGELFDEGERGAIEIAMSRPLSRDDVHNVRDALYYSFPEWPTGFSYSGDGVPFVRVEFTQGINWPVAIASVVAGVTVLTAASLGYALYKAAEGMPWIMPVTLFGLGMFVVFRMVAKEAKGIAITKGIKLGGFGL